MAKRSFHAVIYSLVDIEVDNIPDDLAAKMDLSLDENLPDDAELYDLDDSFEMVENLLMFYSKDKEMISDILENTQTVFGYEERPNQLESFADTIINLRLEYDKLLEISDQVDIFMESVGTNQHQRH